MPRARARNHIGVGVRRYHEPAADVMQVLDGLGGRHSAGADQHVGRGHFHGDLD